jgi:lysozyme family protein
MQARDMERMKAMSNFDRCCEIVLAAEGGFSDDPADPGNWTGGRVGRGARNGTKYGISAAAYPSVDIEALTVDGAKALFYRDYWTPLAGDALPPPLALVVFDTAVNSGRYRASLWLQQLLGVGTDGVIGPMTLDALHIRAAQPGGTADLCAEFLARRLFFLLALPTWNSFGSGWTRRLFHIASQSMTLTA